MKINRGFMFGFAALFVTAMFTLAGCDDGGGGGGEAAKTLASIAITTQPTKTTYTVGDKLDTAGMVVTATYSDGSTAVVKDPDYTISGFDSSKAASSQIVTVSYNEGEITKTATFTVTINAAPKILESIAITKQPTKTAYTVGDMLDTRGMVVTATYSDGSKAPVTGYATSPVNGAALSTVGSQTVTVSYTEGSVTPQTATFTITINPTPSLKSISIVLLPTKTTYTVGGSLDTTGILVAAWYSDGSYRVIMQDRNNWGGCAVTGFDSSSVGIKTVTVSYTEEGVTKTATFTVTINAAGGSTPGGGQPKTLSSIAITTQPAKTTYTVGELLDTAGMIVTATYSDDSTAPVTDYTTSPVNGAALSTVGSQTVTVSHTEGSVTQTATFVVTVFRGLMSIQPGSDDPVLTVSADPQTAGGYNANFTISVSSGYTVSAWRLDGAVQTGQTGNTFTVPVSSLADGNHSVTVIAVKGGKTYSATKTFKVHK
jgi:predicted CoA-binding protein